MELARLPVPRALLVMGWVAGYDAGLKHETRVDVPEFWTTQRVITLCRDIESTAVITLVDQALHPDRR